MPRATFVPNPADYKFEGQDRDEKILLLLRAHIITNLSWVIPAILVFLLPFFLPWVIGVLNLQVPIIPTQIIISLLVLNYLLVLTIVYEGFLYWYFNVSLVTNKEILDIDFESLLFKNIDIAPMINVQEANSDIKGVLGVIFGYGTVYVQTAGAKVVVNFKNVPQPHLVADMVMDQANKVQKDVERGRR